MSVRINKILFGGKVFPNRRLYIIDKSTDKILSVNRSSDYINSDNLYLEDFYKKIQSDLTLYELFDVTKGISVVTQFKPYYEQMVDVLNNSEILRSCLLRFLVNNSENYSYNVLKLAEQKPDIRNIFQTLNTDYFTTSEKNIDNIRNLLADVDYTKINKELEEIDRILINYRKSVLLKEFRK